MNTMCRMVRTLILACFFGLMGLSFAFASPTLEPSVEENINIDHSGGASDIAYVRLYGRDPKGAFPGHAYIEIYDAIGEGNWKGRGKLGLYPKSTVASVYTFISDQSTEGILDTHEEDNTPSRSVTIKVAKSDIRKVESVITKWKNHPYDGYTSDCVTFVEKVVGSLGLIVPRRDKSDYPRTSVTKIGQANL